MLKVLVDYPSHDEELTVVARSLEAAPSPRAGALARRAAGAAAAARPRCYVDPALISWTVDVATATRRPREHGLDERRRLHRVRRQPARADQPRRGRSRARADPRPRLRRARRPRGARARCVPAPARALVPRARRGGRARHDPRRGARRGARCRRSTSDARARSRELHRRRSARTDPDTGAPGPGPLSAASLRALELSVGRRVDGLLAGDYRSAFAGVGSELWQVRAVRARRRRAPDRVERDRAHRRAARSRRARRARARHVARARRVGVDGVRHRRAPQGGRRRGRRGRRRLRGDAARQPARHGRVRREPTVERPRQGRRALLDTLQLLRELPPGGTGTLRDALELTDRVARQRALVVVVSDFRGPPDWRAPLLRLAGRHTVLAVEIRDPREQELADVGELRLVDPETGRQLRVDTSDRRLRERFAAAAARRAARARRLARLGRRPSRRALDRGRLAAAARRVPAPEGTRPVSFAAPLLLLFLLVVPVAVAGLPLARPAPRRARDRLGAGRAAAEHGRPPAEPGGGTSRSRCCSSASRCCSSASRGPRATFNVKRAGGDARRRARRLGLDGGERRAADAARPRRGSRPHDSCDALPKGYRCRSSPSPTTSAVVAPPTRDLTRLHAAIARAQTGPAGNRARRGGRRARSTSPRSVQASSPGQACRRRRIVVLSDGGQTAGRTTLQQAAAKAREGAASPCPRSRSARPTAIVHAEAARAASPSGSRCRCSRSRSQAIAPDERRPVHRRRRRPST